MSAGIVFVRSQWRPEVVYAVNVRQRTCTCAVHRGRHQDCKHILLVCGRRADRRREER